VLALAGTAWRLESMGEPEDDLVANPEITSNVIYFLSRYSGYGGCNWFLGVYELGERSARMYVPAQTRFGCQDLDAIKQEATFMSGLMNTTEYELEDDKLIFYTVNNQRLMTLVSAETLPLEGTTWQLALMADERGPLPMIVDTAITAEFDAEQISGTTGCSDYSATFERGPNTLPAGQVVSATVTIGEVTLDVKESPCTEPEGIAEQEQRFLSALNTVAGYGHGGSTLVMFNAEGEPVLLFGARP
jgi:heat shock protein HslJ